MSASQTRYYLYGFTLADDGEVLATSALAASESKPVFAVAEDGLAAVVSAGAAERYRPKRQALLAHQAVLETVMARGPVLPARFGTVLPSRKAIREILSKESRALRERLEAVRGRVEYAVRARWQDEKRLLNKLAEGDGEIMALRREHPKGVNYQLQLLVGERLAKLLEGHASELRARLVKAAAAQAEEVAEHKLAPGVVANLSFLIVKGKEEAFMAALEAFDQAHGEDLSIKVIGPLPPFSFSEIRLGVEGSA